MWNRFTERARQAVIQAQIVANRQGENFVRPEHLLLAVLQAGDTPVRRIFREGSVAPQELARHLDNILTPGPGRDAERSLRLDPDGKRVLELAAAEAARLRNLFIGPEHLLLGILAANTGPTGIVLRQFGPELNQARRLLATPPDVPEESAPASAHIPYGASQPMAQRVSGLGVSAAEAPAPSPRPTGRAALFLIILALIFLVLFLLTRG